RLTARPKVAVAWPVLVNRNSGSRVTLPTSVTVFPLDMGSSPSVRTLTVGCLGGSDGGGCARTARTTRDTIGKTDHLVPAHVVRREGASVELGHGSRLGARLHQDVVPLALVVDLVGQPPLAPPVDPAGVAAPGADELGGTVDGGPDGFFL